MLLESVLSKLTAAGLATKAAAGGAALVVAASAAGAADALPEPAQDAFDSLTGIEAAADAQDVGEGDGAFGERVSADATGESDGTPGVDGATIACEASEGRSGTCDDQEPSDDDAATADFGAAFGERVSGDATGESDGEPGVDGEEISQEARELNPRAGEEGVDSAPAEATNDDDDDGDAEGGPEGTPGEDAVNAHRPGDDG